MKVSKLKFNPNNPRKIAPTQLEKLKKSIRSFPEMMPLRPIVYDPDTMHILGGNQRLAAIRALGMKEIPDSWAIPASELTDAQKREFVLKDNALLGEWDYDILSMEWGDFDLDEIGIDNPVYKNINIDEQEREIRKISLCHYLISIPIDKVLDAKEALDTIKKIEGVDVEQSQN